MKNINLKIWYGLSILSFLYYLCLSSFLGIVGFHVFWFLFGLFLIIIGLIVNKKIYFKVNKIIKNILRCLIFLGLSSFIILESLIIYHGVERSFSKTDYLIVLGAKVNGQTLSRALKQRIDKAAEYLNEFPNTKVIVSGGKGNGENITEAEAMKRYLVCNGIDNEKIIKEDRSTTTYENVKYSQQILKNLGYKKEEKVSLITSNFHMMRAGFLAKRVGININEVSAPTDKLLLPNYCVREYVCIIHSLIFDTK